MSSTAKAADEWPAPRLHALATAEVPDKRDEWPAPGEAAAAGATASVPEAAQEATSPRPATPSGPHQRRSTSIPPPIPPSKSGPVTVDAAKPARAATGSLPARPKSESTPPPPFRSRTSPTESRADDSGWVPATIATERSEPSLGPPPTRTVEPFQPAKVAPIPDVPEPGLIQAVRYAVGFARARWQRRAVIRRLRDQIQDDTTALDGILGTLGKQVRALGINSRALSPENEAIDEAEARRLRAEHECAELSNREAEENSKFAEIEGEREGKVSQAEEAVDEAQNELAALDAQRRSLRDKRKEVERRQRSYVKAAEDREAEGAKLEMGDARASLRQSAEGLRRDAAGLDPERQDLERRLSALERPMSQVAAKVEALKAELEAARRSLNDAREGHRHRLAEVSAEQGRKTRELAQAESEIQRRLVTLGTLINLNRVERSEFTELYRQVDELRGTIGARSTEIDRLSAEREAYDKASLVRGAAVLVLAVVLFVALVITLFHFV